MNNIEWRKILIYISIGIMIIVLLSPILTIEKKGFYGGTVHFKLTGMNIMSNDYGENMDVYPIPGALAILWIVISLIFMRAKKTLGILLSILISIADIACLFLLLFMQYIIAVETSSKLTVSYGTGYYLVFIAFLVSAIGFINKAMDLKKKHK